MHVKSKFELFFMVIGGETLIRLIMHKSYRAPFVYPLKYGWYNKNSENVLSEARFSSMANKLDDQ